MFYICISIQCCTCTFTLLYVSLCKFSITSVYIANACVQSAVVTGGRTSSGINAFCPLFPNCSFVHLNKNQFNSIQSLFCIGRASCQRTKICWSVGSTMLAFPSCRHNHFFSFYRVHAYNKYGYNKDI